MSSIKISMTFEVVTPESAEDGDMADHGFAEPGGWQYSIADEAFEARCKAVGRDQALKDMTPEPMEFEDTEEAVDFLAGYGSFEASCSPLCDNGHCWLTQADSDTDYSTGAETRLAFHLEGVDPATHRAIVEEVLSIGDNSHYRQQHGR
jgi:hypothetical protein